MMISGTVPKNQPRDYAEPRRKGGDRRKFSFRTIYFALTKPRRLRSRREEDARDAVLDHYGWTEMISAVTLMVFSCIDASFTLMLLARGGEELNPVMNYFLQLGVGPFIAAKMLITVFGVFFFIATWNLLAFSVVRVRAFLFVSIGMYIALIVWELHLLSHAYPAHFPRLPFVS
ncbi:DUF5658 family protein [Granulosicoccaceae sp. 1_MG-2023]|nr:DUF5658 family protein [Granulosicoccaceae sp. 1_MG-2023]